MKNLYALLIIMVLASCNRVNRLYLKQFEAKSELSQITNNNVIRIFFDRKGYIYPDYNGDPVKTDEALRKDDSRLESFYCQHPDIYKNLCRQAGVVPSANVACITAAYEPLQQFLVGKYIADINKLSANKQLVFIIHGFNEKYKLNTDYDVHAKIDTTEGLINDQLKKECAFVEIYWDGLSKDNGYDNWVSKKLNSIKIWGHAQASACFAGLELRRVLSGLSAQNIYVVSHSHGSAIITNALFNVRKFKDKYYKNPCRFEYQIAAAYHNPTYNTPTQQYHIGMLAPAIPGYNVFKDYYKRTVNGEEKTTLDQNYHFLLGFNSNDPILTKFGTSASFYGSTTLGCDYNELDTTLCFFNYNYSLLNYIDFSLTKNDEKQKSHYWRSYIKNPHHNTFLKELFK